MTRKISVLMPVFNAEKYLDESISSILQQTYKNFEFIIIDDGSSDNSRRILKKYKNQYKNHKINLIFNKKNIGIAKTLNKGIKFANGTYIARMDADDISAPDRLEKQLDLMESKNLDLCGCHWLVFDEYIPILKFNLAPLNKHSLISKFANGSPFAHGSVMMRRDFLIRNNLKYASTASEDYRLWIQFYDLGARISSCNLDLYRYRKIKSSLSHFMFDQYRSTSIKIRKEFISFHLSECFSAALNLFKQYKMLTYQEKVDLFYLCIKLIEPHKYFQLLPKFIFAGNLRAKLHAIYRVFISF
jgi:glycosyltransferase involved in cell wall biosynthesis